jgi:hypothetical protein
VSSTLLICGTIIVKNSRLRSPFIDATEDFLRCCIRSEAFIDGFNRQGFQREKRFLSS